MSQPTPRRWSFTAGMGLGKEEQSDLLIQERGEALT